MNREIERNIQKERKKKRARARHREITSERE